MVEISERTLRRWTKGGQVHADQRPLVQRPEPPNKLSGAERTAVISICNYTEFYRLPPSQIVPKLADQGHYLASESSFYRILRAQGQQHHRGRPIRPSGASHQPTTRPARPARSGPGSEARPGVTEIKLSGGQSEAPNTWMPGPVVGMFFYLYLIVGFFSRKIVGWEVHEREGADLAAMLIQKAVWSEACIARPLVLHADPDFRMGAAP